MVAAGAVRYRRPDGKVGVRNHVIILPVDDISNAACEAVAAKIPGTLALPHAYGRLQFGEDLDLHFRTMIGTGANPNVAAAIVIGIEPNWTQRIVDGIAETGKPVEASRSRATATSRSSGRRRGRDRASSRTPASCTASPSSSGSSCQHQVRRIRHHHGPWLVPDRRRVVDRLSTQARPCSSARPPS